ncbi:CUN012 hypothetical protein [Culex nigripalpus nucleopolyhedrovirus]|uniref:Uncharacterized protein n=1 Tax=Culex nigripalpus nucleopolyhedrovirus (isolate Florida/1997) TaxID=645993 RepID=Q919Q4_NPVCO|nr:CUN012 hypothetical protein [Culex nigripalpus nucleopolyhedrovirus]AAK94090.1 CUN012 hypothetical protein [Culex nigripalpus nucleopolyhedrovirus]
MGCDVTFTLIHEVYSEVPVDGKHVPVEYDRYKIRLLKELTRFLCGETDKVDGATSEAKADCGGKYTDEERKLFGFKSKQVIDDERLSRLLEDNKLLYSAVSERDAAKRERMEQLKREEMELKSQTRRLRKLNQGRLLSKSENFLSMDPKLRDKLIDHTVILEPQYDILALSEYNDLVAQKDALEKYERMSRRSIKNPYTRSAINIVERREGASMFREKKRENIIDNIRGIDNSESVA